MPSAGPQSRRSSSLPRRGALWPTSSGNSASWRRIWKTAWRKRIAPPVRGLGTHTRGLLAAGRCRGPLRLRLRYSLNWCAASSVHAAAAKRDRIESKTKVEKAEAVAAAAKEEIANLRASLALVEEQARVRPRNMCLYLEEKKAHSSLPHLISGPRSLYPAPAFAGRQAGCRPLGGHRR